MAYGLTLHLFDDGIGRDPANEHGIESYPSFGGSVDDRRIGVSQVHAHES